MLDPSLIVWTLVLVVVGLIVAHWAGLEPFVKLGLKQRRPVSSRILAKPAPSSNAFRAQTGTSALRSHQDTGRVHVPQSPVGRALKVPSHVRTPTPLKSFDGDRPSLLPGPYPIEPEYRLPSSSRSYAPSVPSSPLARVPSSPILSDRPRQFYDAQLERQFQEQDPFQTGFALSSNDDVTEYTAADGSTFYLETQTPPPYVDYLPARTHSQRRKRSESIISNADATSEYGDFENPDDMIDEVMANYPRSSSSSLRDPRSTKKKRHMTSDEKLEYGRSSKLGKNTGKRARVIDDTRSEVSAAEHSPPKPSKRRRLRESTSTIQENGDVYNDDGVENGYHDEGSMMVDYDGEYAEDEIGISRQSSSASGWANGSAQVRRTSSTASSQYASHPERDTVSRGRSKSKMGLGRTPKSTKRASSTLSNASAASSSTMAVDDIASESSHLLRSSPGSVVGLSHMGGTSSVTSTPRGTASAIPSANHSPTKPNGLEEQPIPILASTHSAGSMLLPSGVMTPATPAGASSRHARLQLLRDQSHDLTSTPVSTPSFNRIPLTNSASKRTLEPPTVSFAAVPASLPPSVSATPLPGALIPTTSLIDIRQLNGDAANSSSSTDETNKTAAAPATTATTPRLVISENVVDEQDEDDRVSQLLKSAHQKKEDRDTKKRQEEEKEKEKQALQFSLKSAAAAAAAAPAASSSDANGTSTPAAMPKFGGFKAITSPTAASGEKKEAEDSAASATTPGPIFKVPSSGAPKVNFGTPTTGAAAASGAPKMPLFGAKPTAAAAEAPAESASAVSPSAGGFKFGASGASAAAAAPASAPATPKMPSFGAKPAGSAATPTGGASAAAPSLFGGAAKPTAASTPSFTPAIPTPSFGAKPAGAATPAASAAPSGLFGGGAAKPTGTPSFGAKPAGAAAAPAASLPSPFGAAKPTGMPSFGAKPSAAAVPSAAPAGLFGGAAPAQESAPTGGFGAKPAGFGAKPTTAAAPSFGAAAAAGGAPKGFGAAPSGGFGASTASPAPSSGGFGAASANKPMGGGFGAAPASSSPAPTGLFGGASAAAPAPSAGGFGKTTSSMTPSTPSSSGFGSVGGFGAKPTAAAAPSFGSPTPSKPAGFGAAPSAAPAGLFGGAPTASGPTGGFGSKPSTPSSGFGAKAAGSGFGGAPAGGFGGASAAPSSGFGGASAAAPSPGFGGAPSGGFGGAKATGAPSGLFSGSAAAPSSGSFGASPSTPSAGGFPSTVRRAPARRR